MEVATQRAHQVVPVADASQPSAARFAARELAARCGFSEEDSYRAGIVVTELATNLVKHARGGEMLLRGSVDGGSALELIAIDRGPGIANMAIALADGHSTTGSSGNGLGAVRRLSDVFDIHSSAPRGTAVLARIHARRAGPKTSPVLMAGVSVAKSGEVECGDAWTIQPRAESVMALIADGLGHGHFAAEAAAAAIEAMQARPHRDCTAAVTAIHEGIRHTRGAAAGVLEVQWSASIVKFAGVGNISATVLTDGGARQTVSHNGTLGHQAPHVREYSYPWTGTSLVVMHSDGLLTHWSLDAYPGIRSRHPALVAGVLYRDFCRGTDDVTVVVGREAA